MRSGSSAVGTIPARVVVHPDIFETGGVYTSDKDGHRVGNGKCLSANRIDKMFPEFDTFMLSADRSQQWYQGAWETDRVCAQRAARVADWMRFGRIDSKAKAETAPPLVLIVSHANFISALLKALCGVRDDESKYSSTQNDPSSQDVSFTIANTATSLVDVDNDGGVRIRWVGGTEHLGTAGKILSRI